MSPFEARLHARDQHTEAILRADAVIRRSCAHCRMQSRQHGWQLELRWTSRASASASTSTYAAATRENKLRLWSLCLLRGRVRVHIQHALRGSPAEHPFDRLAVCSGGSCACARVFTRRLQSSQDSARRCVAKGRWPLVDHEPLSNAHTARACVRRAPQGKPHLACSRRVDRSVSFAVAHLAFAPLGSCRAAALEPVEPRSSCPAARAALASTR